MPTEPAEPEVRHVWVRGHGQYSPVQPGLVISWQHSPVHKVTDSCWTALVLVAPFPGAMLVESVNATASNRSATQRRPMERDEARRRHVWVDCSGGNRYPGLVIAWRRAAEGWEAYVAILRESSVLVT